MASTRRSARSVAAAVAKQRIPPFPNQSSVKLPTEQPTVQIEPKPQLPPKRERAAPAEAQGAAKKKKPNPPSKPVKGGWVLPHGMGLALNAFSLEVTKNESASVGKNVDKLVEEASDSSTSQTAAEGATQNRTSIAPLIEEKLAEAAVAVADNTVGSGSHPRTTRSSTRSTQTTTPATKETETSADDEDVIMNDVEDAVVSKSNPEPPKAKPAKPRGKYVEAADKGSSAQSHASDANIGKGVGDSDKPINGEVEATMEATVGSRRSSRTAAAAAKSAISKTGKEDTPMSDGEEHDVSEPELKKTTKRQPRKFDGNKAKKPEVPLIDQKMKVKRGTANKYGLTRGTTPYPNRKNLPTKEQCYEVHDILTEMHGEVKQPTKPLVASLDVAGCGEVPSVLDALLRTLISGNTLMANADMAVKNLVKTYGILKEGIGAGSIDWNAVRLGTLDKLIDTIRPGGCPRVKGGHIKAILDIVFEEQKLRAQAHQEGVFVPGAQNENDEQKALEVQKVNENYLSLDHMYAMTADEAITEFVRYPGIGVKTAACVVLFCLRIPCFAVDTHVHKFCVWLGWVPEKANELDTFNHGEYTVPDPLKYGLHQLFIRHGQQCFKCRKNTKPGTKAWEEAPDCPLEHLLDRSKGNFGRVGRDNDEDEEVKLEEAIEGQVGIAQTSPKAMKKRAATPKKAKNEEDKKIKQAEDGEEGDLKAEKKGKAPTKKRASRAKKSMNEDSEQVADPGDDEHDAPVAVDKKKSAAKTRAPRAKKAASTNIKNDTEKPGEVDEYEDVAMDPMKESKNEKEPPAKTKPVIQKNAVTNKEAATQAEPGRYGLRRRS